MPLEALFGHERWIVLVTWTPMLIAAGLGAAWLTRQQRAHERQGLAWLAAGVVHGERWSGFSSAHVVLDGTRTVGFLGVADDLRLFVPDSVLAPWTDAADEPGGRFPAELTIERHVDETVVVVGGGHLPITGSVAFAALGLAENGNIAEVDRRIALQVEPIAPESCEA